MPAGAKEIVSLLDRAPKTSQEGHVKAKDILDKLEEGDDYDNAILLNLKEEARVDKKSGERFWNTLTDEWDRKRSAEENFRQAMKNANPSLSNLGKTAKDDDRLKSPLLRVVEKNRMGDQLSVPRDERARDGKNSDVIYLQEPYGRPAGSVFATSKAAVERLIATGDADGLRDTLGLEHIKAETILAAIEINWTTERSVLIPLALDNSCLPPFRVPNDSNLGYGMTRHLETDEEAVPEVLVETPIKFSNRRAGKPVSATDTDGRVCTIGTTHKAASREYLKKRAEA